MKTGTAQIQPGVCPLRISKSLGYALHRINAVRPAQRIVGDAGDLEGDAPALAQQAWRAWNRCRAQAKICIIRLDYCTATAAIPVMSAALRSRCGNSVMDAANTRIVIAIAWLANFNVREGNKAVNQT